MCARVDIEETVVLKQLAKQGGEEQKRELKVKEEFGHDLMSSGGMCRQGCTRMGYLRKVY